jgi:hypothetical protein
MLAETTFVLRVRRGRDRRTGLRHIERVVRERVFAWSTESGVTPEPGQGQGRVPAWVASA